MPKKEGTILPSKREAETPDHFNQILQANGDQRDRRMGLMIISFYVSESMKKIMIKVVYL
jgi:hypothetical protein